MKLPIITIFTALLICTLAEGEILEALTVPKADSINNINVESFNVSATVLVVDDIERYKLQNPRVVLQEIPRSPIQPRVGIQYTIGTIGSSRLVAQKTDSAFYSTANDVVLTLQYPASGGIGAIVAFVNINVNQDNYLGGAYIAAGGIGYRYITIIVEAKSTRYFQYQAYIYGY